MIYALIGRRELGKTTLAMFLARKFAKRVALDPRGMIHFPTAERVYTAGEASDAVAEMLDDPRVAEVIYQPTEDDLDGAFQQFAEGLKAASLEFPEKTWAIVIDEASFFDLNAPSFQWLLKCTPRERVHIFITAHRPQDVPTRVRAITDHWLVFSIRQEHDLKALRDRNERFANVVAHQLAGRDFAHWDDALAELSINRTPDKWGPKGTTIGEQAHG